MKPIKKEAAFYIEKFLADMDINVINWKPESNVKVYMPMTGQFSDIVFCTVLTHNLLKIGHCYNAFGQMESDPDFILEKIGGDYFVLRYNNQKEGIKEMFYIHDIVGKVAQPPELEKKQEEYSDYLLSWLRNVYSACIDKNIACMHCGEFGMFQEIGKLKKNYICIHCSKEVKA